MSTINKLKVEMYKNRNRLGSILSDIKYGIDNQFSVQNLIKDIYSKNLLGYSFTFEGLICKNYNQIHNTSYIPFNKDGNIEDELKWAYEIIKLNSDKINKYIELRELYEKDFLLGEYTNAKNTMSKINDEVSFSLWGAENEFALQQMDGGYEENRKYLSKLGKFNQNNAVNILFDFYSNKANTETSYILLKERIFSFLGHRKTDSFFYGLLDKYLKFKLLLDRDKMKVDELRVVLSFESTMSIIDYYNTFIDIVALLLSNKSYKNTEVDNIVSLLLQLNKSIKDNTIKNIILQVSSKWKDKYAPNISYNSNLNEIFDLYTLGNYLKCLSLIRTDINEICNIFEIMELESKLAVFIKKAPEFQTEGITIYDNIVFLMSQIQSCNDKKVNIGKLLNKLKLVSNLSIRYGLEYFISKQEIRKDSYITKRQMDFSFSKVNTPRGVFAINDNNKKAYIALLKSNNMYNETLILIEQYLDGSLKYSIRSKINEYRLLYYKAKFLCGRDNYEAIVLFEKLLDYFDWNKNGEEAYYFERVVKELYTLFLEGNQLLNALNIMVESYLKNKSFIARMDIDKLNNKIMLLEEEERKKLYNSFNWPIFHYIIDKKNSFEMYKALFAFLETNDKFNPLDIFDLQNEFRSKYNNQFICILEKIYVYEVMKHYVFFNVAEKNIFRINILEHLLQINPSKIKLYELEKAEITYEQGIREKLKVINKERIYVDVKKILLAKDATFKYKYRMFTSLKESDVNLNCADIYAIKNVAFEFTDSIKTDPDIMQKQAILKEILVDFKEGFLYNFDYGLEKFLSSRIRHGIDDYLLKSFVNTFLLSTHDSEKYKINKKWAPKIIGIKKLETALNCFSKKIIEKIEDIKSWIMINSSDSPNGLFDYSKFFERATFNIVYTTVKGNLEYEQFYNKIAKIFWINTDYYLGLIRDKLKEEVEPFFIEAIEVLEAEINDLNKDSFNNELLSEIQNSIVLCKTKVRSDIDCVINWFYTRNDDQYEDYTIAELIEICIESNNKLNNQVKLINKNRHIEDIKLNGSTFINMWNSINILYTNAISLRYSGFDDYRKINIGIIARLISEEEKDVLRENLYKFLKTDDLETYRKFTESNAKVLLLSISNNLDVSVDIAELKNTIQGKFETSRKSEDYKRLLTHEGGTGLVKLNNILGIIGAPQMSTYEVDEKNIKISIYLEISNISEVNISDVKSIIS